MGKHWGTNLTTVAVFKDADTDKLTELLGKLKDGGGKFTFDITVKAKDNNWKNIFLINNIVKVDCFTNTHKYVLDFDLKKYTIDDKEFYLTENEARTLYFYSVCGVRLPNYFDTMYALRKRMGNMDFLSDFIEMYQEDADAGTV